jgi:dethiobiotin synthetase
LREPFHYRDGHGGWQEIYRRQAFAVLARIGYFLRGNEPICCGDRRELLLAAGSEGLTIDGVNPVWLKTPAAPIVGSLIEKLDINIEDILSAFRSLQKRVEYLIVEGAGGWMVPIDRNCFVSDLAAAMKLPVLAVAYNRLAVSIMRSLLCRACADMRSVAWALY